MDGKYHCKNRLNVVPLQKKKKKVLHEKIKQKRFLFFFIQKKPNIFISPATESEAAARNLAHAAASGHRAKWGKSHVGNDRGAVNSLPAAAAKAIWRSRW